MATQGTTLDIIEQSVADYVNATKIANKTFNATFDNTVGLIDKVGKQIMHLQNFNDKLQELDRGELPLGKTIEEAGAELLCDIDDYDPSGSKALQPKDNLTLPPSYSYTLGRKTIKTTIRNDDVDRACIDTGFMTDLIMRKSKTLNDTEKVFRYGCKRELIGRMITMVEEAQNTSTAFSATTDYNPGDYVTGGVCVKKLAKNTSGVTTLDIAVNKGYFVKLSLISSVDEVVDTASGEKFIAEVKKIAEIANDISEGHSLSGNALGAQEGLTLYIKPGVMPVIEAYTLSGAIHDQYLAMPVKVKVIKDFGSYGGDAFAVLVDDRGLGMFDGYRATRSDSNADGDFQNVVRHMEATMYLSKAVFVHTFQS